MKLTRVLLPTKVILAVLTTVVFTATTSTSCVSLMNVAFSLQVAFATLVHSPIALDLATIQYVAFWPLVNVPTFQDTV